MPERPSVLFVCVKNGGKSQMAAALMRQLAGDSIEVHSAGTAPGAALNEESVAAVEEVGASTSGEQPTPIDPAVLARVDRVVVLGAEAVVEPVADMRGTIETWETDEPSTRGVGGMERMRLVRDDIARRVRDLHAQLVAEAAAVRPRVRVFEPALCCNTGVCGPDVDEALVRFTADLEHLCARGADIARHNLANDPTAFASEPAVAAYLRVAGSAGLPLVLVDGVTVATGRYPHRDELARLSGLGAAAAAPAIRDLGLTPATAGGCCGGESPSAGGCC